MRLRFVDRSEDGTRFVAVGGHWPAQKRYEIEACGDEWSIHASEHRPGKGFVYLVGASASDLELAKFLCDCMEHGTHPAEAA